MRGKLESTLKSYAHQPQILSESEIGLLSLFSFSCRPTVLQSISGIAAALLLITIPASGTQDKTPLAAPPTEKGVVVLFVGKPEEVAGNWLSKDRNSPAAWKVVDGA